MDDGGTGAAASSAPASLSSKSPPPSSTLPLTTSGGGGSGGSSDVQQKDKDSYKLANKKSAMLENGHTIKRERDRDRDKERKRQRERERERDRDRERHRRQSHGSSSASTDDAAGGDSSDAETVILPLNERRPLKKLKRVKRVHPRINDDDDIDESSSDDESRGVKLKDRRRQKEVRRHSTDSKTSSRSASPSMAAASASSLQPMRKDGSPIRDASGRLMLQKLCDKGDYERAKTLLQVGVDVNDRDYAGNTAIHDAALKGHARIVELLLDNGAIIDIRSGVGDLDTPLIDAASRSRVEVVKLLLDRGADPRIFNAQGKTALDSLPADDPNHDELEKMLKMAAFKLRKQRRDSNAGSGSGNDSDLNGKPQPNADDFDPSKSVPGTFPDPNLHKDKHQVEVKSSSNGGPRRRGARSQSIRNDLLWMDLTTRTGREMVYRKAADGDIQFVGRSLEEGWQPDGDCLVLAAKHGHTELVSLLLAFGGHSDAVNEDGETALEQTIGRGHIETVKLLLKSGADPLRRDRKGRSYYDIAREAVGSDDEEAVLVHDAIENANNGNPSKPTTNNETTNKNNNSSTATNTLTTTNSNDDRKRRDESEIDRKLKKRKLKREREEREREKEREKDRDRDRDREREASKPPLPAVPPPPGSVPMKRAKSDEQRAKLSKDKKRVLTEEERKRLKVEEMDKRKREKQLEKERERREIERREREREKREREEAERAEKERLAALAKQRELELEQERERQRQAEEAARLEAEQRAKEQEAKLAAERAREAERKKREELEALKERNRKERERKMLENLEAEEKRKKEKRERDLELEKEREQKQRAEQERLESLHQEQELERQRQAKLHREAEQRRHLPFGIRNAHYGTPQSLEQMQAKLPLIARAFKSAVPRSTSSAAASRAASPDPELPQIPPPPSQHPFVGGDLSSFYLIDIQIALLLGLPSIYQAYPELSKKLVTDQEKSKLWSLVTPWMCRPLDPYADDMPSTEDIMTERQEDRKRFSAMTFFWLKMDQVVEIMKRDHPVAFQLYSDPKNVALAELEYEMVGTEKEPADATLLPPRIRAKHEALMRSRSWGDMAAQRDD